MRFFRYRRGQIRGIDFSLSIIIFSLTITQIMVLTTTFIDGNRTLIQLDQQEEITQSLATEFLHTNGYFSGPTSWTTVSTPNLISGNWNLGLTSNGEIDPFKLGRLSNKSLTDWVLDYDSVRQGLNFSQTLSITILNPIDIQIEAVGDDNLNTITVNGSVSKLNKPLNLAEVWVYSIDTTENVAQGYGTTTIDGDFSIELTYSLGLSLSYYTIIAFAKYGESSQDADVDEYVRGGTIPNKTPISIFESNNGTGYNVNVTAEFGGTVNSGNVYAFYPGVQSGTANNSFAVLNPSAVPGFRTTDALGLPQSGMSVIVGFGYNAGTLDSISIVKFPVTLDNDHSSTIEPTITQQSTSTTTLMTFTVRGLLLQLQFTTWEF